MGSHESARTMTDEWYTPPEVFAGLGTFDLDPAAPPGGVPWVPAARHFDAGDDGLHQPWAGSVWLNPPYSEVEDWMQRMAEHGDGIALVFARTETRWWNRWVWHHTTGVLFVRGRIAFCRSADPTDRGESPGAPSALVAYGAEAHGRLWDAGLSGAVVAAPELIA